METMKQHFSKLSEKFPEADPYKLILRAYVETYVVTNISINDFDICTDKLTAYEVPEAALKIAKVLTFAFGMDENVEDFLSTLEMMFDKANPSPIAGYHIVLSGILYHQGDTENAAKSMMLGLSIDRVKSMIGQMEEAGIPSEVIPEIMSVMSKHPGKSGVFRIEDGRSIFIEQPE